MLKDCVVPSVKHGGGFVIWGCFAGCKVGDLVQIKGFMKKKEYHNHKGMQFHLAQELLGKILFCSKTMTQNMHQSYAKIFLLIKNGQNFYRL